MIDDSFELLKRGIQIRAIEENRRDWRWLWLRLRRRAKGRVIFAGYATSFSWERNHSGPDRMSIELESAEARVLRSLQYRAEELAS